MLLVQEHHCANSAGTPAVPAYRDATLNLNLKVRNATNDNRVVSVETRLLDDKQNGVFEPVETKANLTGQGEASLDITQAVKNPKKWSAESPNLYRLLLTLKDDRGKVIESIPFSIGFRSSEIKDGQLLFNGRPLIRCMTRTCCCRIPARHFSPIAQTARASF